MTSEGFDFVSRLQSFLEMFGFNGLLLIILFVCVVVGITFIRGIGLLLLTLFISYSLGAMTTGGIIILSTLLRWGCLALLGLSFFKYFHMPNSSILLMVLYSMLGFIFSIFSPAPLFSIQQSILLLVTVVFTSVAISSYVDCPDKIAWVFIMGIVAASVWAIANLLLTQNYIYSGRIRFTTDKAISGVTAAYAGAFFMPMVIWGIIQRQSRCLRVYCAVLIIPFLFILLLTGVRSALFGMVGIAMLPLLLLKVRPSKILLSFLLFAVIIAVAILAVYTILPTTAERLFERIFSTDTSGRTDRWVIGLKWCLNESLIFGKGMGSSGIISSRDFGISYHNAYLSIWGNTGLIGLLVVLLFLFIYVFRAFRLVKYSSSDENAVYSRILLGYMLAIVAMGFFEGLFSTAGGIGIFMLIMTATLIDRLNQMIFQGYQSVYPAEEFRCTEGYYPDFNNVCHLDQHKLDDFGYQGE